MPKQQPKENSGHTIKHRTKPQDDFSTPEELARRLIALTPLTGAVLDPFRGGGAFYNNLKGKKDWCEIKEGRDFFERVTKSDWIISNPPYSCLDLVLRKTCVLADKGFAYLLFGHALTPRRIEMIEQQGFGLTKVFLTKVFKWYGISVFCVFEKGKSSIINYDRIVWR